MHVRAGIAFMRTKSQKRKRMPYMLVPRKLIAEETEKWGKVIRAANIKAE